MRVLELELETSCVWTVTPLQVSMAGEVKKSKTIEIRLSTAKGSEHGDSSTRRIGIRPSVGNDVGSRIRREPRRLSPLPYSSNLIYMNLYRRARMARKVSTASLDAVTKPFPTPAVMNASGLFGATRNLQTATSSASTAFRNSTKKRPTISILRLARYVLQDRRSLRSARLMRSRPAGPLVIKIHQD